MVQFRGRRQRGERVGQPEPPGGQSAAAAGEQRVALVAPQEQRDIAEIELRLHQPGDEHLQRGQLVAGRSVAVHVASAGRCRVAQHVKEGDRLNCLVIESPTNSFALLGPRGLRG